jgi:hypothetical protein
MERCPSCGQSNYLVMPRWCHSRISKKEAEKDYCHLKEGDSCQVCLKLELDFLDRVFPRPGAAR